MNKTNYFELADEYITLHEFFNKDTLLEKLYLLFDILQPVYSILMMILEGSEISMFVAGSLYRVVSTLEKWIRYCSLYETIKQWKFLIDLNNGPVISTNDPKYQPYVYADGMQRYYDYLFRFRFTKKCSKRL